MKRGKKPDAWAYPECRACGVTAADAPMVVHHIRYRGARGHGEKPGDIVTMCAYHHDDYHRRYGMSGLVENTLAYCEATREQWASTIMYRETLQVVEDFLNG